MNHHDRARKATLVVLLMIGGLGAGCGKQQKDVSLEEYRKYLTVSQIKSSYYTEPKTQQKYALVEGSLSNLGSKRLIVVEITLRFRDGLQNVIYEEQAYPIYVSDFARPEANQALNPGEKTRFAFKSTKCPPTWQPGMVNVEITKIVAEPGSV